MHYRLKSQIPDIKKTLDIVHHLQSKKVSISNGLTLFILSNFACCFCNLIYCVACEASTTHRDHDSGGGHGIKILVSDC